MSSKNTFIYLNLILSLFFFWGCAESLPPRSDPVNLFGISITTEYNIVNNFGMLDVFITLKSNYEETLQDVALLDGTIMIDWTIAPELRGNIVPRRTVHIEPSQIVHARKFDNFTRMLTIDPGDSIVLRYRWNFKMDDSTDLYKQLKYQADKGCVLSAGGDGPPQYRRYSPNQPFLISAQVKIFGRSATVYSVPFTVVTCVTLPGTNAGPPKCKAIDPDNPCSSLQ